MNLRDIECKDIYEREQRGVNCSRLWLLARPSFCTAIVIGFVVCCASATAEDNDHQQEIWQKKVPEQTKQFSSWLKSRKTGFRCSSKGRLTFNDKPTTFHTRLIMKRKGSFYLFSSEGIEDNPMTPSFCYGINSKYAFKLKKSKNGKDWVIQNVAEATKDFEDKDLGDKMGAAVGTGVVEGFRAVVSRTLDQDLVVRLISDGTISNNRVVEPWKIEELPGFRLRSISADGPRQNILHVNFDYDVMIAERKKSGVASCQIDFDLEAKCYPVKSHQVLKTDAGETILDWSNALTQTKENEYELKSYTQLKKKSKSAVTLLEETQAETVLSLDELPESDFTLSAFGLPEPPGIEWEKPFPWYLVLAGVGTVCLGVFFFLRSRDPRKTGGC